jgi:hypothetical protein
LRDWFHANLLLVKVYQTGHGESEDFRVRWLFILPLLVALLMVRAYSMFAALALIIAVHSTVPRFRPRRSETTFRVTHPQSRTRRYAVYAVALAEILLIAWWVYLWLKS